MEFIKSLIKSHCVASTCLRALGVVNVAAALCFVFCIDEHSYSSDFALTFFEWLMLVVASLLSEVVLYGFATIVDAAHLYVTAHAPEEEEEY